VWCIAELEPPTTDARSTRERRRARRYGRFAPVPPDRETAAEQPWWRRMFGG
jgi:hypothetical protein